MIGIYFLHQVIDMVLQILMYAIVIRAILSWIPNLPYNAFVRILHDITEPLLKPFRGIRFGGSAFAVDLSPILAYFVLLIIRFTILPFFFSFF